MYESLLTFFVTRIALSNPVADSDSLIIDSQ